jgi:hypothetical protein
MSEYQVNQIAILQAENEALRASLAAVERELADRARVEIERANTWHHVGRSARPELDQPVMVYTLHGKVLVDRWRGGAAGWSVSNVTHWRHLPAGPHEVCDVDVP